MNKWGPQLIIKNSPTPLILSPLFPLLLHLTRQLHLPPLALHLTRHPNSSPKPLEEYLEPQEFFFLWSRNTGIFKFSIKWPVSSHLYDVVMKCNKIIIWYVFQDLLKLINITLFEYDREFTPIQNIIKREVVVIWQKAKNPRDQLQSYIYIYIYIYTRIRHANHAKTAMLQKLSQKRVEVVDLTTDDIRSGINNRTRI